MSQLSLHDAFNLAVQHHQAGRLHQAEMLYRRILEVHPNHADALHFLGLIADHVGKHDIAVDLIRGAIAINPNAAEPHCNLGTVLRNKGQFNEAVAAYRQAIALRPGQADLYDRLAIVLAQEGHLDEAIAVYRQMIALQPNNADAHCSLSIMLMGKRHVEEALAEVRRALAINPRSYEAQYHLGNVLKDSGKLDEAIEAYRQALELRPDLPGAHSNLLYTLYFHPDFDANKIAAEHRIWNQQHAEPLKGEIQPHLNDRDPDRRLRIGYISPSFRQHPVGRFLLPLLENHDRRNFEIFGYTSAPATVEDEMTQRLRSCMDVWRSVAGLSFAQAADLIRQDSIDILVDLTLHMAHSSLLVFARKPAPVQITYLAYAGTSGLTTMDYRISDPYLDPPGMDESIYSEKTVRLPETYWCYPAPADYPIAPPPALENGFITFGCLNNFCKVNDPLLRVWAKLLIAVPKSRLILHTLEGSHRQRVLDFLQCEGVEPSRITFVGKTPTKDYFQLYHSIDIAMDTAPYGGGTTTCDALWMGVPVISLACATAVGRGGLSILSNIGAPELVAGNSEEYVQLAERLANDLPRLKELRSTLRQRMQTSPLMDGPKFARNFEDAYRRMWRTWCQAG